MSLVRAGLIMLSFGMLGGCQTVSEPAPPVAPSAAPSGNSITAISPQRMSEITLDGHRG